VAMRHPSRGGVGGVNRRLRREARGYVDVGPRRRCSGGAGSCAPPPAPAASSPPSSAGGLGVSKNINQPTRVPRSPLSGLLRRGALLPLLIIVCSYRLQ
jgi:hypothetical protein